METQRFLRLVTFLLAGTAALSPLRAAPETAEEKMARLEKLVQDQQQQINALIQQQAVRRDSSGGDFNQTQREYLAKLVREELAKNKELVSTLPGWLSGLEFFGDLRVRYEGILYESKPNSTTDQGRSRGRFRLRFGFKKVINDEFTAVFRLASGEGQKNEKGYGDVGTSNGISTNQTFTGDFTEKGIYIDQAYIEYTPRCLQSSDGTAKFVAGKQPNPFVGSPTGLIWDSDLNPEGLAQLFTRNADGLELFAALGEFFLEETNKTTANDVTLLAAQLGFKYKLTPKVAWRMALAYYYFCNAGSSTALAEAFNNGNPASGASGSKSLNARQFHIVDLYTDLTFADVDVFSRKMPVTVFGEVVWNSGDHDAGGKDGDNLAFEIGGKLGAAKKKGDWEVLYSFKYVQANAVLSALTDGDFGGSNQFGHTVGFKYALADNVFLGLTGIFTQSLGARTDPHRQLLQADLEVKFK
ncbi:MAG: hypothetical protein BIFFINMI_00454 [Phycisphaerae bacterium]|nr:hypothetical protein [Phycisphaerae bacterium]